MTVRKYRKLVALGLVLTTWVATPALATESGAYLGVSLGQSKFEVDEEEIEGALFGPNVETDDSDTAWSIAFGYRFNPYIGAEISYQDMGALVTSSSASGRNGSATYTYSGEISASVKGPAVALVAAIPIGHFEINARLGVIKADTEVSLSESGTVSQGSFSQSFAESDSVSSTTTETLYGIGMGYTFGEHVHLRLDWITAPDVGDEEETGEGDVSVLSAGLQYRF